MKELIRDMAAAFNQVHEKKMDPVDKKAVKKDYDDREDKDIDNDGDTDSSDRYLHKRRKAVTKAVSKGKNNSEVDTDVQELSQETLRSYASQALQDKKKDRWKKASKAMDKVSAKDAQDAHDRKYGPKKESMSPLERYKSMVSEEGQMARDENKADGEPNTKQQAAKPNPPEKHHKVNPAVAKEGESAGRKDVAEESMVDRVMGIFREDQEKMEKISGQPGQKMAAGKDVSQKTAEKSTTPDTGKLNKTQSPDELDANDAIEDNRKAEVKSSNSAKSANKGGVTESYAENESRYVNMLMPLANEISAMAKSMSDAHKEAMAASERVSQAYKDGKEPTAADIKAQSGRQYNAKELVRTMMDCRDALETSKREVRESIDVNVTVETPSSPSSIRSALTKMAEASREERYKGATKPQEYDDNWSAGAKAFADKHKVAEPPYADINKVTDMNKTEVGASLARSVNYRSNDQKIGDKTQPGAEKYKGKTS